MTFLPQEWLAKVAVKKAIYGIAKGLVGVLTWTKSQAIMQQLGVQVDPETFQAGVTTLMLAGASALHDYLKLKFPGNGWI